MEDLKRYSGVIMILIAVAILAIPAIAGITISSNKVLVFALVLIVVGLIVHIFMNKNPKS